MSLTERYRGTPSGLAVEPGGFGGQTDTSHGVSRCRVFVVAGLVLSIGVYGVALAAMGSPSPSLRRFPQALTVRWGPEPCAWGELTRPGWNPA